MFKGRTKGRKSDVRAITHLFHGVEVVPGPKCCDSARALAGKRLLSDETPMLPLETCTMVRDCSCRYTHYKDRRTERRREADDGLPARLVEKERRNQSGRRVTDG